mmetsp:Transcript_32939/g.42091  ORF Transcript_32939/g.42091 Transcript_32939/m.42091 type:complete len:228 (+) Transcript_32939:41-724(+)
MENSNHPDASKQVYSSEKFDANKQTYEEQEFTSHLLKEAYHDEEDEVNAGSCSSFMKNFPLLADLHVGQDLDVLDSLGQWSEATVLKIDKKNRSRICISYKHLSSWSDEWVTLESGRVAALGTHTFSTGRCLTVGEWVEAQQLGSSEWVDAVVVETSQNGWVQLEYQMLSAWRMKSPLREWVQTQSGRIRTFGTRDALERNREFNLLQCGCGSSSFPTCLAVWKKPC